MKIYMTQRNMDMTEGRGPMMNDKAFLHREHAAAYIDTKAGVMGRKAKWSEEKYGDWRIEEMEVLEYDVMEAARIKEETKQTALAKLTDEEKEALGLG
jgi:hypothetical protein